jgi:hypothetical protein
MNDAETRRYDDAETRRRGDAEKKPRSVTVSPRLRVSVSLLIFLLGCSSPKAQVVVAPPPKAPEVAKIKKIWVKGFEGDATGEVAKHIAQSLQAAGIGAANAQQADAFLTGTVVKAKRKVMIYMGNTRTVSNNQAVVVSNPVVSLTSSQVVPESAAVGATNPHIVGEKSFVAVMARLSENRTGNLRWSYEFNYESVDPQHARQAVVTMLSQSLRNALK